jgi:hypothetical protein
MAPFIALLLSSNLAFGALQLTEKALGSACQSELASAPFALEILSAKGLDPAKLGFKMHVLSKDDFEIVVLYDGRAAGRFGMSREPWEKRRLFRSSSVYLNGEFTGKGLGSFLYLIGARLMHDEIGGQLRSDVSRTDMAVAAWRRFIEAGLSYEVMVYDQGGHAVDRYTVFHPGKIVHASEEIYPFFLARIQNPEVLERLRNAWLK